MAVANDNLLSGGGAVEIEITGDAKRPAHPGRLYSLW
jgi:hypothetical protein